MRKVLTVTVILLGCISGIALAQFSPFSGQGVLPSCNYTWACAKTLGNATACSCTNPSTNSSVDYIYTTSQVSGMSSKIGIENSLVNTVVNAS